MYEQLFFGLYASSQSSVSGCVEQFVISETGSMENLPSGLMKKCTLCNVEHSFYHQTTYFAATKTQRDNLLSHFASQNIRTDVAI